MRAWSARPGAAGWLSKSHAAGETRWSPCFRCAGPNARASSIARGWGPPRAALRGTARADQGRRRNGGTRHAATILTRVIYRADWLDIRQRTEDDISAARREYDRLTGSATVMSDIPPSERVRDAWESWNTDRRRAAIRAVLHRVMIKPLPPGARAISRSLSVSVVTLGSHKLERPHPVAADPFCGFLDGVRVLEAK